MGRVREWGEGVVIGFAIWVLVAHFGEVGERRGARARGRFLFALVVAICGTVVQILEN